MSDSHVMYKIHVTWTPSPTRNSFPSSRSANISELIPLQSDHTVNSNRFCCPTLLDKWPRSINTRKAWGAHFGSEVGAGWLHGGGGGGMADTASYCTGACRLWHAAGLLSTAAGLLSTVVGASGAWPIDAET